MKSLPSPRSKKRKKPVIDKRATNAIKICINRLFKSKSAVHLQIAQLVSKFSHASIIQWGSIFEDRRCNFIIVQHMKSPFFARVTYVPPLHVLPMRIGRWYAPDWKRASNFHVKKVYEPFSSNPYVMRRGKQFCLQKYSSLLVK